MVELKRSIKNEHFIESVLLSWSHVEQVSLPRLILFVSDNLKVKLPKDFYRLNVQNLILLYYTLSHDKDLFDRLEAGRTYRNKVVHKLYKEENISNIQEQCREAVTYIVREIHKPISYRFSGKVLIPSINLYQSGWNDALNKVINELEKSID